MVIADDTTVVKSAPKLVLVDAYSLLFRAHFANPYLSTLDGRPTGALFGFSSMILSILNSQKPDSIIICWDSSAPTLRKVEYEAYKAHRPETDPQLKAQMPEARALVEAFGIQSAELPGYEADDLVGTMAAHGVAAGMQVVILTGDSDQLQLVREGVAVEICQRGVTDVRVYGPDEVLEKYGVGPERLPDWKGLVGDTSDNIPGVPGIGEKTATALLQTWGTLDNVLQHVSDVTPNKAKNALEANSELAILSRKLATIICDAPIDTEIKPYKPTSEHWRRVRSLFEELQFKSLLTRLPRESAPVLAETLPDVQPSLFGPGDEEAPVTVVIRTADQFEAALRECENVRKVGLLVHLENNSHPLSALVLGIAFAASSSRAWYVPFRNDADPGTLGGLFAGLDAPANEPYSISVEDTNRLLTIADCEFISHNAKPQLHAVVHAGIHEPDIRFDTFLAGYLLDASRSQYPIEDLVTTYLNSPAASFAAYSMEDPSGSLASQAACLWRLAEPMRANLEKLGMLDVMNRIEMPLEPVLAAVERVGLLIDAPYLSTLSIRMQNELSGLAAEIYGLAGEEFNIGSTKQLQQVLFEKLQLPTGKKTKTGYSTGAELLEPLAVDYPIARKILDYREISKLKATYADALVKLKDPADGRIHTTLNQTVASTGRLSSSEPNLQNIPVRSEAGREIRRAFVAAPGKRLLSCDYSQIELRVLAHMSGDPALKQAFIDGEDVHAATAARVFDVPLAMVTSDQRRQAKTINFAVIYGQSAFALGATLGVDTRTASEWIKEYFHRLPGVQEFIARTTADAHSNRFVTTLMGRRRYLPELDSPNHSMRQFAERAAVNMPIQGTAADIMKLAMIQVYNEVQARWSRHCTMLLQVHDELLFEIVPEAIGEITPSIQQIMGGVFPLDVPLAADAKSGLNWADMSTI